MRLYKEKQMIEKMKKMKDENKILVMLAVFSIAMGLWGNFRQLWLQDNNLTVHVRYHRDH